MIKIIDDRYPDKIKEYKTLLIQIENSKKFSMMNSSPSESFRQSEISQNSISSFGEHNLQIYEYKEDHPHDVELLDGVRTSCTDC